MYKSLDTVYLQRVLGILNEAKKVDSPGMEAAMQVQSTQQNPIEAGLASKPKKVSKKATVTQSYDEQIYSLFPTAEGKQQLDSVIGIKIPTGSGVLKTHINNNANDRYVWSELFKHMPVKKSGQTETKGSGFGELALYWFLKKGNPGVDVRDNRAAGQGAPDLMFGDIGIEVKSYPIGIHDIPVGRFRSAGEKYGHNNNVIINSVLGINALLTKLSSVNEESSEKLKKQKIADGANFRYEDFLHAFQKVDKIYKAINSDVALLNEFSLFKQLNDNISEVYSMLGSKGIKDDTAKYNATQLMYRIMKAKLFSKPGPGGYICNVDISGDIEWFHVTKNMLDMKVYPEGFDGDDVYATGAALHIKRKIFEW